MPGDRQGAPEPPAVPPAALEAPEAEAVQESIPGPVSPPPPAEDEFGFPELPYDPAVDGLDLPTEPDMQPFGIPLVPLREREVGEGPVSLGVAPAGDVHLPSSDALEEEEVGSEVAARVLESLARRVRSGEIALPAGVRAASEAPVLAGLLAVLLSTPETGITGGERESAEPGEAPGEGR